MAYERIKNIPKKVFRQFFTGYNKLVDAAETNRFFNAVRSAIPREESKSKLEELKKMLHLLFHAEAYFKKIELNAVKQTDLLTSFLAGIFLILLKTKKDLKQDDVKDQSELAVMLLKFLNVEKLSDIPEDELGCCLTDLKNRINQILEPSELHSTSFAGSETLVEDNSGYVADVEEDDDWINLNTSDVEEKVLDKLQIEARCFVTKGYIDFLDEQLEYFKPKDDQDFTEVRLETPPPAGSPVSATAG